MTPATAATNSFGHVRLESCRKGSSPTVDACVASQRDRWKKTSALRSLLAYTSDEGIPILVTAFTLAPREHEVS